MFLNKVIVSSSCPPFTDKRLGEWCYLVYSFCKQSFSYQFGTDEKDLSLIFNYFTSLLQFDVLRSFSF